MKQCLVAVLSGALAAGVAASPAAAQTRQMAGKAGYLAEWELTAEVSEKVESGRRQFSGPVIWKHIGVCSVNGPQEKRGEISFQLHKSFLSSTIEVALSMDGDQCTYSGDFAEGSRGTMDCSKAKGIPLSFTLK